MTRLLIFTIVLAVLCPSCLLASGNITRIDKANFASYIITASERGKVLILNEKKEIIREIDARNTYDASILKNGDILFAYHHGVKVVNEKDEEVFHYKSESEIFACQAIARNRFLIGECSAGRLLEVNRKGEILKEVPLTFNKGGHQCFRSARKLKNGNYMVSHYGDKTVREYDRNGAVVHEFVRPHNVYASQRLKNGNTVISDKYSLSIYNKKRDLIWEFNTKDYPGLGVNHLSGFQFLSNKEIVVCNWLGHKLSKKGVPIFKINLDKEIIWKYTNREQTHSCTNIKVY